MCNIHDMIVWYLQKNGPSLLQDRQNNLKQKEKQVIIYITQLLK